MALQVGLGHWAYNARETHASGAVLNREQGRLPALTGAAQWGSDLWWGRVGGVVARHDVRYEGMTQAAIPITTQTRLAWQHLDLRGGVNLNVANGSVGIRPFAGLRQVRVERDITAAALSLPLRETLHLTQAQLGAELWWHPPAVPGIAFSAGAQYVRDLRSRLDVMSYGLFDPITLRPAHGAAWQSQMAVHWRVAPGWTLGVQRETQRLRPGASPSAVWTQQGQPAAGVRYPGSEQALGGWTVLLAVEL